MTFLIIGLAIFLGIHSVAIAVPGWRDARLARLGEPAWKGIYSVISFIGLGLIIYGYGIARQSPVMVYMPPHWLQHVALLLLVPVFPLLFAAYLPGRISTAAKHPMLLAVKIWATAHLLANGSLHDVLLFGSFLTWAVADRIAVKRRVVARQIRRAPASRLNDLIAVIGGLIVYGVFLAWAHRWLIGVSPLA
jgi:uncharacterized membrane protein